jgi:hypothetical protein
MKHALDLAAVLSAHALAVFDLMDSDPSLDAGRKVWRWIERGRKPTFTARDCFQRLKGSFQRMRDLEPAFEVLKERSYIAEAGEQEQGNSRPGPGRRSRIFLVNPNLTRAWSQ